VFDNGGQGIVAGLVAVELVVKFAGGMDLRLHFP